MMLIFQGARNRRLGCRATASFDIKAVKAETERLNREEFVILDQILAARKAAGLTQANVAQRMGTKA